MMNLSISFGESIRHSGSHRGDNGGFPFVHIQIGDKLSLPREKGIVRTLSGFQLFDAVGKHTVEKFLSVRAAETQIASMGEVEHDGAFPACEVLGYSISECGGDLPSGFFYELRVGHLMQCEQGGGWHGLPL